MPHEAYKHELRTRLRPWYIHGNENTFIVLTVDKFSTIGWQRAKIKETTLTKSK